MAKYRVVRTFPSAQVLQIGQIIEDPEWHNLDLLVSQGYLKDADEPDPEPGEKTVTNEPRPADAEAVSEEEAAPVKPKKKAAAKKK